MKNNKIKIIIASVIGLALMAGAVTMAFLTDTTEPIVNILSKGKKFTLTYHANTGSQEGDANVSGLPAVQEEYDMDNDDKVKFTISSAKPLRSGMVFVKWTEGEAEDTTEHAPESEWETTERNNHLYAQWTAGYTLIYDANGGDNAPSEVTMASGEASCNFDDIAEQGDMTGPEQGDGSTSNRVFLGWADKKDATEPDYTKDGKLAYGNTAGDYDGTKVDGFDTEIEVTESDTDPVTGNTKTKRVYAVWATRYELRYELHPELTDPPSRGPVPETQTFVTMKQQHVFHIPKRVVPGQEGPGEVANAPSRGTTTNGYEWGWWGDTLDRYGYKEDGTPADNEGCYLFDEDFKPLTWDEPVWTLYAYFQPPAGVYAYYYSNAYVVNDEFVETSTAKMTDPRNVSNMPNSPIGTSSTDTLVNVDIASKEPEHPKYKFLGWSTDPDATEPEYKAKGSDDSAGLKDSEKLDKRKSNILRLYAVWQHKHKFRINFNKNGSDDYYQTNYWINSSGKWTSTSTGWAKTANTWVEKNRLMNSALADKEGYYLDESYEFSQEFFDNFGVFATRPDDNYGSYKFVGWSYTKYPTRGAGQYDKNNPEHIVEFPIDGLPEDPSTLYNQTAEGDTGKIRGSITAEESDPPCDKPQIHEVNLYAVWERSPLHNFSITFSRNDSSETMSRGTATANSYTYTYPADYTNPKKTTVRATEEPMHMWTKDSWTGESNATTCPVVTKKDKDDGTATYEFIGWSKEKNKTKEENVDYGVDDVTKILNEDIMLGDETQAEAKDCDTGTHSLTLYPVFKPVLRHKYGVYFDVNQPVATNLTGIEVKLYQKQADDTWTIYTRDKDTRKWSDPAKIKSWGSKVDVEGVNRQTSEGTIEYTEIKGLDTKTMSWPSDYTSTSPAPGMGLFATCENKNAISSTEYKFLGWSYTKYPITGRDKFDPTKPDHVNSLISVTVPEDLTDIKDGEGLLSKPIVIDIDETDPESQHACKEDADSGKVHNRVLYGVWTGEPLHMYSVTFDGNGAGSKVKYGSAADWQAGTTKDDSKDGKCVNYSEARKPAKESATDEDKYTFDAAYWTTKDVIAEAERTTGDGYEYTFAGWSLDPNTDPSETSKILTTDGDGHITQDIIADCNKYPCDGSQIHDVKLYAVWNKRQVHRYSVIFYNDGTKGSVKTKSGDSWSDAAATVSKADADARDLGLQNDLKNAHRVFSDYDYLDRGLPTESHTWNAGTLAVKGHKNSTDTMEYTFVGWSETPLAPSTEYTRNSDVIALHIDDDGYITDDITLTEPDSHMSCQYDTHNKIYYPVFRMDPIHKFTIEFNYNSGNGIRYRNGDSWTYTTSSTPRSYSYGPVKLSESGSSYTWAKEDSGSTTGFWDKEGIGAYKNTDAFYRYEFVGWSKTKQATPIDAVPSDTISWRDDPDSNLDGAGYIDEDITVNCPVPCEGGSHDKVTYYAVWRAVPLVQTYNLKFDPNDTGVENMPADIMGKTETYDDGGTYKGGTWKGFDFTMPTEVPVNKRMVFTGWSTNKNAMQGEYGYQHFGPNNNNPVIGALTAGLKNTYHMETNPTTYEANKTETMYAIWWYEFYLEYSANGGSNAPPLARTIKSEDNYTFTLSKDKPNRTAPDGTPMKFLGWATSPDATQPEYQPLDDVKLTADSDRTSPDYGYTELKLYAVWEED